MRYPQTELHILWKKEIHKNYILAHKQLKNPGNVVTILSACDISD